MKLLVFRKVMKQEFMKYTLKLKCLLRHSPFFLYICYVVLIFVTPLARIRIKGNRAALFFRLSGTAGILVSLPYSLVFFIFRSLFPFKLLVIRSI